MLRGFLEEGHPLFIGERGRRVIDPIKKLLEKIKACRYFSSVTNTTRMMKSLKASRRTALREALRPS